MTNYLCATNVPALLCKLHLNIFNTFSKIHLELFFGSFIGVVGIALYCNLTRIPGALAPDQREADQHITHRPDIFKKHVLNYQKTLKQLLCFEKVI